MQTRRHFLSTVAAASAALAVSGLIGPLSAAELEKTGVLTQRPKTSGGKYRPPFRFGLGGAPIGNSVGVAVSDEEAETILENTWNGGVRLYDTSPWYGLGLSERRFGALLHNKKREDYVLSTKIGRVLTATSNPPKTAWANPDSFDYRYDYTADATRRSVEDSLQRLGVSSIDIVYIHDLSPDNTDIADTWEQYFDQAARGAMPELTKMREEGMIKGWGMGVNTLPPILKALEVADPDIMLAACQYSLIEHEESVNKLFPACDKHGVSIMVGSPLNSGFLAGSARYNYSTKVPQKFIQKRDKLRRVCANHGVDLRTAALQFTAAPQSVSCVIPGARRPGQAKENIASMAVKIPSDFWNELKETGLVAKNAPVPG